MIPGTHSAYPTADDLKAWIEGTGLSVSAALETLLDGAAAGAANDFESAVHRTMLAPSSGELRYFAPPLDGAPLVGFDLAAAPATITYQPTGSSAETLTLNTDYWCGPENAIARGKPLEWIEFDKQWTGLIDRTLRRALQITGLWGYAETLPDDVWLAVCMRGAWNVWQQVTFGSTEGMLGFKEGDLSVDYGLERWRDPVRQWCGDGNDGVYGRAVGKYRKLNL